MDNRTKNWIGVAVVIVVLLIVALAAVVDHANVVTSAIARRA
jgi:hypothetical protein